YQHQRRTCWRGQVSATLRIFRSLIMKNLYVLVLIVTSSVAFTQTTTPATPTDHARVFITDSQSWEVSGGGGGSSAGFGGASHGGARPQTAEILKTFGERCPDVVTNNIQAKTDYVVVLDHEGGKGLLRHA